MLRPLGPKHIHGSDDSSDGLEVELGASSSRSLFDRGNGYSHVATSGGGRQGAALGTPPPPNMVVVDMSAGGGALQPPPGGSRGGVAGGSALSRWWAARGARLASAASAGLLFLVIFPLLLVAVGYWAGAKQGGHVTGCAGIGMPAAGDTSAPEGEAKHSG